MDGRGIFKRFSNLAISPQPPVPLHVGAGHVRRQRRPPGPLRRDELPGDDDYDDDDDDDDDDDHVELPGDG